MQSSSPFFVSSTLDGSAVDGVAGTLKQDEQFPIDNIRLSYSSCGCFVASVLVSKQWITNSSSNASYPINEKKN